LNGAKAGIDFLQQHCFDKDGRMFFHVTRDGKPIRKRRYFFSETFAAIAFAAYAKATGDNGMAEKARELFGKCIEYATTPGLLPAKFTNKGLQRHWRSNHHDHTAQQIRDLGDEGVTSGSVNGSKK
jgi:N-acylglucosamine 2-epimerase